MLFIQSVIVTLMDSLESLESLNKERHLSCYVNIPKKKLLLIKLKLIMSMTEMRLSYRKTAGPFYKRVCGGHYHFSVKLTEAKAN